MNHKAKTMKAIRRTPALIGSNLPARKILPTPLQKSLKRFSGAKEAVLFEMQTEYADSMRHFGVSGLIEEKFFPYLRRGIAIYAKAKEKLGRAQRVSDSDRFYLSEGFDEHMRNWRTSFITNYRGQNKEQVEPFLEDFYTRLIEKLEQQQTKSPPRRLLQ